MKRSDCQKYCAYSSIACGCQAGLSPSDCKEPRIPTDRYYDEVVDKRVK